MVVVILLLFLILTLMLVWVAMATTVSAVLPLGANAMINQIIRLCCAPANPNGVKIIALMEATARLMLDIHGGGTPLAILPFRAVAVTNTNVRV